MPRERLTAEQFEEVFADHLMRNPMVRSSFSKLPEDVREKLKAEWFGVWKTHEAEDLQEASRVFLAEPDHISSPGRDINKHCGRVAKLAREFRSRRMVDHDWGAPQESTKLGCSICKGSFCRRVQTYPFGPWREWAIELFGLDHWKAAGSLLLICPCNKPMIAWVEERLQVDPYVDRRPTGKPRFIQREDYVAIGWPAMFSTVFDEERHERYVHRDGFYARCLHERDVLNLGKPRGRYGANPSSGDSVMDDIVDEVWEGRAVRPRPAWQILDKRRGRRREAVAVGQVVGAVVPARPPAGQEAAFVEDPAEETVAFPGTDEELDEMFGPPTSTIEPLAEKMSPEERRRRRRAAHGLEG
jgi:hypothetical protein